MYITHMIKIIQTFNVESINFTFVLLHMLRSVKVEKVYED